MRHAPFRPTPDRLEARDLPAVIAVVDAPGPHADAVAAAARAALPGGAVVAVAVPDLSDYQLTVGVSRAVAAGANVIVLPEAGPGAGGWTEPGWRFAAWGALQRGAVLVAAAGNSAVSIDAVPFWPASTSGDNVLVAMAANPDGSLWWGSNTTTRSNAFAVPVDPASGVTGTSFAAPVLAASAARALDAGVPASGVAAALRSHAAPDPVLAGKAVASWLPHPLRASDFLPPPTPPVPAPPALPWFAPFRRVLPPWWPARHPFLARYFAR